MPSFRTRVLDALNIEKQTVKLPIKNKFIVTDETADPVTVTPDHQYALSKRVLTRDIGNGHKRTLDLLGFQIGEEMKPLDTQIQLDSSNNIVFPATVQQPYPPCSSTDSNNVSTDTCFHAIGGLYDSTNLKLKSMRKSAMPIDGLDSMTNIAANNASGSNEGQLLEHSHKDWPSTLAEQLKKLNEDPYCDSLWYHSMNLRLLITGVDNPTANTSDSLAKASNHRGLVRMVCVRPITPKCRLRFRGDNNEPIVNMRYMPNIHTDLFYSGKRMLGGRLDKDVGHDTEYGDVSTTYGLPLLDGTANDESTATFSGLRRSKDEYLNQDPNSIHYGHVTPISLAQDHDLTPFDVITSPINRDKYSVVFDKTFHLDVQHHGVGSQRVENVTIPFNMKARFAGRMAGTQRAAHEGYTVGETDVDAQDHLDAKLTDETNDECLNMPSKPFILFMSMDQKLSVEMEGYTVISET